MDAYRRLGQKIVFTNGCLTCCTWGTSRTWKKPLIYGDVLIVAVNRDRGSPCSKVSVGRFFPPSQRAALLAALEVVDHVLVFDERPRIACWNRFGPMSLSREDV